MYSNTPSVSKAIKDILFSNSIYLNSLKLGIANFTALALKIKPELDRIIGSEVNINTIVVSIKRIADALEQNQDLDSLAQEEKEKLAGARISLTGSILDVEFNKEMENIEKILELFDRQSDIRFNIFQSKNHMNLFIENISEIKKIFSNNDSPTITPSKIKEGVSMITISLPWEETELRKTYQLLSMISTILYDNQISLHNAFFTPTEIVLIINDKDAAKVYELLRVKFYR
ncbi:MAG TPA: hypothetical protein VFP49_13500 [Nitrososphaeraceae archaeon]|jgi:hypothetical protein|nr:hypothetical protein [Nitrososphaeraceae archaeon]